MIIVKTFSGLCILHACLLVEVVYCNVYKESVYVHNGDSALLKCRTNIEDYTNTEWFLIRSGKNEVLISVGFNLNQNITDAISIVSENGFHLKLQNVSYKNVGKYMCNQGEQWTVIHLNIINNSDVSLNVIPSRDVYEGQNVTLTCVIGTHRRNFNWTKNGMMQTQPKTENLTITNVTGHDNAVYGCTYDNTTVQISLNIMLCKKGYTSRAERPPTPCGKRQYGPRCLSCNCSVKRCDPVFGCISEYTIHSSSDIVTRVTVKIGMNDDHSPANDNIYGLSKREWILYPLFVVLIIVIVGSISVWRKYIRRISNKFNRQNLNDEGQENHEENVMYHEIDESNQEINIPNTFLSGEESAIDLNDTGYYVISYHVHKENICRTCQFKHSYAEHIIESDDSSTSSSENTGYLNPYQPLQSNWQEHSHVYSQIKSTQIPCNLTIDRPSDQTIVQCVENSFANTTINTITSFFENEVNTNSHIEDASDERTHAGKYDSVEMSDSIVATQIFKINIQTTQINHSVQDSPQIEPLETNHSKEEKKIYENIDLDSNKDDYIDAKSCI